jgi:hypothetical protein
MYGPNDWNNIAYSVAIDTQNIQSYIKPWPFKRNWSRDYVRLDSIDRINLQLFLRNRWVYWKNQCCV